MKRKFEDKDGSRFSKKFKKSSNSHTSGNVKKAKYRKKPVDGKFNGLLLALQKDVEKTSSAVYIKKNTDEKNQLHSKKAKLEINVEKKPADITAKPVIANTLTKKPLKKINKQSSHVADNSKETNRANDKNNKINNGPKTTTLNNKNNKINSGPKTATLNDKNNKINSGSKTTTLNDKNNKINSGSKTTTLNNKNNKINSGSKTTTLNGQQKQSHQKKVLTENSNNAKKFEKSKFDRKLKTNDKSKQESNNEEKPANNEIWFDDVDEILIQTTKDHPKNATSLIKSNSSTEITKAVAMDCEMVGIGWKAEDNMLARVSIVNHFGHCLYDKFVKPREKVMDYRTKVSGIRPTDIAKGADFGVVQKEVYNIIKGRMLVGHSIKNDLKVLFLDHPHKMIRDTAQFKPFRAIKGGRTPSLKKLSEEVLGVKIQEGEHDSVQDAQAAMRLYTMYKQRWETSIRQRRFKKKEPTKDSNKEDDDVMEDDDDDVMEDYD